MTNEEVLQIALGKNWITVKEVEQIKEALSRAPHLLAIDFLYEQELLTDGQAQELRKLARETQPLDHPYIREQ